MKETKFRRLRRDELEEVKSQFVKYLAVNGIDAKSCQDMTDKEPSSADGHILQFSHTTYPGVIEKVEYLLPRRPTDYWTNKTNA